MTFDAISFILGIAAAWAIPTLLLLVWIGTVELLARSSRRARRTHRSRA